jgi:hypothetical protein
MNKSQANPTEALFDGIAQFIAESRALLDANKMLELSGLDDHVQSLCDAVLQLSQEDRLKYADRLQFLLGDLKALGDNMVEKREVLAEEMRHVSHHKKASTAYRVVEASDGYISDDEGAE